MAIVIKPVRRDLDADASLRASRSWWDACAADYQVEHGDFLGDADFLWCPEGLRESYAGLLGDVRGRRVLEVGAGPRGVQWLVQQRRGMVGRPRPVRRPARPGPDARRGTGVRTPPRWPTRNSSPFPTGPSTWPARRTARSVRRGLGAVMREVAGCCVPADAWRSPSPTRSAGRSGRPGPEGLIARDAYFDRRFSDPDERDRAADAIRTSLPELSVESVDLPDEDWAAQIASIAQSRPRRPIHRRAAMGYAA